MIVSNEMNADKRMTPKRKKWFTRNDWTGYLFSAPLIIGVLAFAIYPMFAALFISFHQTSGLSLNGKWVGLSNYRYALEDPVFWQALTNTFLMGVLSVVLGIVLSFVLASLINNLKWNFGKNFFKAVYFLPNVVSAVATSLLFSFLFFPSKEGLLNFVLSWFGVHHPIGWFTNPEVSRYSIVLMSLWGALGYNTIIFLAGLQSVPRDLYEAAEVDGAGGYKKWLHITIPYLRPIFVFMLIMGTIGGMKRFTDVWLIGGTAGNPGGSLMTVVLYIYRNAFLASQMGLATAASYLLFIIILVLTAVMMLLNRRKDSLY
ncbi:carbohydrate ABC transporter membrane protein 1 (CUT1 family) [Paenibacillus sp. VMFN-D1]|uniref:Multiple sugar transport system permease protein/cellobiose transport system permease protein n=2 Tax=Paenibacillus TaxID=44249 RepID=A0ABV2EXU8_9BACL|nr:sugar ABC transporter permease [Paenibacillus cellulositrophicus]MCM2999230.1 sugar ABC transporter permease [Paenibacillus cellulositrophicus]RED39573.1 carbohydrate ABC transporter membrane protein 1 (CUT1 family) [Paenibacillus sp. VMFN-D1]